MSRKYFKHSIQELEVSFQQQRHNQTFLAELLEELSHRNTQRALRLKNSVQGAIDSVDVNKAPKKATPSTGNLLSRNSPQESPPPTSSDTAANGKGNANSTQSSSAHPVTPGVMSSFTCVERSQPERLLSAWTALEVLSPQTYRKPADLAGGSTIDSLNESLLPWERGEKSRPNYRLYYQVVLGSVKMEPAIERLVERYGDPRPERPAVRGNAVLATIVVDKTGRAVESPCLAISSFGWGVMTALNNQLSELARWSEAETKLVEKLERQLLGSKPHDENSQKPLTRAAIMAAFQTLVSELGLPSDFVEPPAFSVRSYTYFKDPNPPEPLLLNSFFLGDLALATRLFSENKAPENLRRYLGQLAPTKRQDLLSRQDALKEAVSPSRTPIARWPGPGRHPLVLLQQAAVNLAFTETRSGGLVAVNGPPGTGKTTLLRDIVAGVVTERAEAMVRFDDPETAFEHSGEKLRVGEGWLHLYRLTDSLRGFELVVASSNNKAVENVSAQLPSLNSIAGDATALRYFKSMSDASHGRETWGMIAAVLGNAQNRSRFKQTFWWDEDFGFSRYLAAAAGTPQFVEERDAESGRVTNRPPKIVSAEKPPATRDQAIAQWHSARKRFQTAVEKSRQWQTWLEAVRKAVDALASLFAAEEESDRQVKAGVAAQAVAQRAVEFATNVAKESEQQCEQALSHHLAHQQRKPGWLARFFRTQQARAWSDRERALHGGLVEAKARFASDKQDLSSRNEELERLTRARMAAETNFTVAKVAREKAQQTIEEARTRCGVEIADTQFFSREHGTKHSATVWYPGAAQKCRDDVFVAAIEVHRAFIDAAAKPIRHNIGVLMNVFYSQLLPGENKQALLPHLWATLFLAVPLVSTTFAAIERMLGRLSAESIGWLLIDEAGQALPQAAVGAIIRSKRAIIVGDPIQVEPVVTLPESLTRAICRELSVEPEQFSAPSASVQTLADSASPFVSEFPTKIGSRTVGIPLLVHRRCAEPMFSVSNAVAYAGLMVNAKAKNPSPIQNLLGPSTWFHVEGTAEEKWCPEEGNAVLRLLQRLASAGVEPNLYIITPFVIVQDRLRQLVRESGVLTGWIADDPWEWTAERIGTIHTVQGREAEAVIFVLGAPHPSQSGARNWAGGKPNLLNVAVTRAQETLYVIGNRTLWREAGHFSQLDARIE